MSRRDRNTPYYGRNTARYERPEERPRHAADWERERGRGREEWPGHGSRRPDERDYTARYLGYESGYESPWEARRESPRYPGSGAYDDERRSRHYENTQPFGRMERGRWEQQHQDEHEHERISRYRGQPSLEDVYAGQTYAYGTRNDYGRERERLVDRGQHRPRDYYREDVGDERHDWGQQLREAGQEMVRKVKRAFRGPKGYKRSDERIREDVSDRLSEQDSFDPSEIEVAVANGEVTLTGSVRHRHEKFLAEEISDDVSGVTDVHNQLRVRPEATGVGLGGSPSQETQTGSGWTGQTTGKNRNAHS